MRVLLFLPATRWRGGCEHYALAMCAGARRAGHDVRACLPLRSVAPGLAAELRAAGAELEPWPLPPGDGWDDPDEQRRCGVELLRRLGPEAVLAALPWPDSGLGMVQACAELAVPAVIVFQLVSDVAGPPTPARRASTVGLDAGQGWVAVSEDNRTHLARAFGVAAGRLEVIYNGVAQARPAAGDVRALHLQPSSVVALTVARLSADKGHLDLLDAAAELRPRHPALHYAWVGDGEDEAELRASVAASPAADRVHLLGWRDDVPRLLHLARLVVLPTHEEGASFALLESMAAGKPIVVSDASSNGELLRHGTEGLLFPTGDVHALAEAIEWALAHEGEMARMAAAARRRAEMVFPARAMIARTLARLESVVSGAAPAGAAPAEPGSVAP